MQFCCEYLIAMMNNATVGILVAFRLFLACYLVFNFAVAVSLDRMELSDIFTGKS